MQWSREDFKKPRPAAWKAGALGSDEIPGADWQRGNSRAAGCARQRSADAARLVLASDLFALARQLAVERLGDLALALQQIQADEGDARVAGDGGIVPVELPGEAVQAMRLVPAAQDALE